MLLRILGVDLLVVGIAGHVEESRSVFIVLERKLRQGPLFSRNLTRLLLDSYGPLLYLLIGLCGGEAVGLGPVGDG